MSSVSLTCAPAAGQLVEHDGAIFSTVREGQAYILVPPNAQTSTDPKSKKEKAKAGNDDEQQRQSVFYNPIQQFNRDLSVLAIKAFSEDWIVRMAPRRERTKAKNQAKRERLSSKRKLDALGSMAQDDKDTSTGELPEPSVADQEKEREDTYLAREGEEYAKKQKLSSKDRGEATGHSIDGAGKVTNGTAYTAGSVVNKAATEAPLVEASCNGSALHTHRPPFRILDALSATGLRALRYAKEIPQATAIVANDMNPSAIDSMRLNIRHNDLDSQITPNIGNAIAYMYSVAYPPSFTHGPSHISKKFEVIDLDPYGTAAPFLDAALQALSDGGLLCVTCTDSGVFASCGYAEKTYALYGGMPVKGPHGHEAGLRLIINSVASTAGRYGLAIEPLLSLSIDYYVRTFIRVRKSPADVKFLASKTMLVYGCDAGCGAWSTQMLGRATKQSSKNGFASYKYHIAQAPGCDRLCEHCGSKTHMAGPMWAGPLHNAAFVEKILVDLENADVEVYQTKPRIEGMLSVALEELLINDRVTKYEAPTPKSGEAVSANDKSTEASSADRLESSNNDQRQQQSELVPFIPASTIDHFPFFFMPSAVSKVIHCVAPPDAAIRGAIRYLGYRATRSHCQPGSIKTNAPWKVIWEIMREWVRQRSPIKETSLKENTAGWQIMRAARKVEETRKGGEAHEVEETNDVRSPEIITENGGDEGEQNSTSVTATTIKHSTNDVGKLKVVFDENLGKDQSGKRLVRYQINPRENWGPMAKAKGKS